MDRLVSAWVAASWVALAGCGGGDPGDGVVDVRAPLPEPEEGVYDLVTPEVIVEAGEERMWCWHVDYDGPTLAVTRLDTTQGRYGHHVVVLNTRDPKPHGTLEDCTDASEMWKYSTLVLPETPLPEGHAVELPAGAHFVFQFHYVNVGPDPIRVRDVARFRGIDPAKVTRWTSTLTTNLLSFNVPAGEEGAAQFDCAIDQELDLLMIGGHMHEEGKAIELLYGPDVDHLESLYRVDAWRTDYRDAPPVTLMLEDPMRLTPGSVLRTQCTWFNRRAEAVGFPEEMCSAFGYVAGSKEGVECSQE